LRDAVSATKVSCDFSFHFANEGASVFCLMMILGDCTSFSLRFSVTAACQ
jgi:hypothetical protein